MVPSVAHSNKIIVIKMFNLYNTFYKVQQRKYTRTLGNKIINWLKSIWLTKFSTVFLFCFVSFQVSMTCRLLLLSQQSRWCAPSYWHCSAHIHYGEFHHRLVSPALQLSRKTGKITVQFHFHQETVLSRETFGNREGLYQISLSMASTTKGLSAWVLQG